MSLLASFTNILGHRSATALNFDILGTDAPDFEPVQGALIDGTGQFLSDDAGNHISYAQNTTFTDYLIAAADSRFVDDAGNTIYLIE
jgi:hypothetical protein